MSTSVYHTVAGLNRALRTLPKHVNVELRDAAQGIAKNVASQTQAKGSAIGRQWKYVGPTVKARRDRIPVVSIGGNRRLKGHKGPNLTNQTVGNLIWGAEFGGRMRPHTMGFLPHLGRTGYALWPTIRSMEDAGLITGAYAKALSKALQKVK